MKKIKTQTRKILSVLLAVVMLVCVVPLVKTSARNGGGVYNNGLGNINIDIYKYPYTEEDAWRNTKGDPYGPGGCTWFVGARIMDLTNNRIGACISKGPQRWWEEYSVELGLHRDVTPSDYSIICWSGHVAILEKIVGTTAYISEGGHRAYPDNDYCCLSECDVSSIPGRNSNFLGYIHFRDYVLTNLGDIIEFGSYPQSKVTDETLIASLNALTKKWNSYEYYSGIRINSSFDGYDGTMQPGDWMQYCDVECNGNKYRGVKFSKYRPRNTGNKASADNLPYPNSTVVAENGYTINTTYWFQYEPLLWKVLDPLTGLVICVNVIDSQPYNNFVSTGNPPQGHFGYVGDPEASHYANDYANSSLRKWLNKDFFETAFTDSQKETIDFTTLNNDACNVSYADYNSAETNDKIFLLSWDDISSKEYVDPELTYCRSTWTTRGTDYAKCQGLSSGSEVSLTNEDLRYEFSSWWLRSPGYMSDRGCYFLSAYSRWDPSVNYTFIGIRPVCTIHNLSINLVKPEAPHTHTPAEAVQENVVAPTTDHGGSYDEVIYCVECLAELSRKTVETDPLPPELSEVIVSTLVEPAVSLTLIQRIIQWFRNLFDKLFGWIK